MNDLTLRPATSADAPALTELVNAAYGHYVERLGGPPRPMTEDYADVVQTHRVMVAERGGEIVGLIVLALGDIEVTIDNVAVHPAQQRTGVGRALLEHAEAVARTEGIRRVHLYTHERMTENLALYERIGYVEYERRRHGQAVIVHMRKPLA
jgi:ribosomal protein S18 acetylase RimI-like enzyme